MKRLNGSIIFHADAGPGEFANSWTVSDLRDLMLSFDEDPLDPAVWSGEGPDPTKTEELGELATQLSQIGGRSVRAGHCFEIDCSSQTASVFTELVNDYLRVGALVPYPQGTAILVKIPSEAPALILAAGDETTGRLEYGFVAHPAVLHGQKATGALVPHALLEFTWSEANGYALTIDFRDPESDHQTLNTLGAVVIAMLALIADDRQPLARVMPERKINAAREKRGKQPIPPAWRIKYVTQLSRPHKPAKDAAKGGTHASPRPHDRRGHPRHLVTGKVVWVRPSRIGEIEKHLTRDRDFYRINIEATLH